MEAEESLYDAYNSDLFDSITFNISTAEKIIFPTRTIEFQILLRVVVSISSILSIIGSTSIILSYAFMKELRTLARHTIVLSSYSGPVAECVWFTGDSLKSFCFRASR